MNSYDCSNDVMEHQKRVSFWLHWVIKALEYRAKYHDDSKLQSYEKEMYDEYTPKLKELKFGSEEYNKTLKEMGKALEHHYEVNSHHPEHFENGISGMSIVDVVEMLVDWMAATSMKKSSINMEYLQNRFDISPQLRSILENTLWEADMDVINYKIPIEIMPITNFLDTSSKSNQ